ncbi:MAG: hypothetical protein RLZZ398_419 [Verrucomicrobiota bacterium]
MHKKKTMMKGWIRKNKMTLFRKPCRISLALAESNALCQPVAKMKTPFRVSQIDHETPDPNGK